jgi:hypothetical protein
MAFWMVALVAVVALGALVLKVVRDESIARDDVYRQLHDPTTPTLEYVVPTGLDPAVVLAALELAGFTASVDPHHTHQHVLVRCPQSIDRQQVRRVIESATVRTTDGHAAVAVRFADET